jgi:hypothetical protein
MSYCLLVPLVFKAQMSSVRSQGPHFFLYLYGNIINCRIAYII